MEHEGSTRAAPRINGIVVWKKIAEYFKGEIRSGVSFHETVSIVDRRGEILSVIRVYAKNREFFPQFYFHGTH